MSPAVRDLLARIVARGRRVAQAAWVSSSLVGIVFLGGWIIWTELLAGHAVTATYDGEYFRSAHGDIQVAGRQGDWVYVQTQTCLFGWSPTAVNVITTWIRVQDNPTHNGALDRRPPSAGIAYLRPSWDAMMRPGCRATRIGVRIPDDIEPGWYLFRVRIRYDTSPFRHAVVFLPDIALHVRPPAVPVIRWHGDH